MVDPPQADYINESERDRNSKLQRADSVEKSIIVIGKLEIKDMQDELADILVSMLEKLPGVVVGKKFKSGNFTVGKKVFAFTEDGGLVLKLPPETVKSLVEARKASLLVMGKRKMKEWVVIRYKDPVDARKHLALFKEAMDYVSSKASEKPRT